MKQRNIKRKLKQYAASCNRIQPEEKEKRIQALMQINPSPRTRGTLWNFVWEQIGYLGRYSLIWQALWIALFCFLMRHGLPRFMGNAAGNEILVTISLLPPVLVLLTVEAVTKVYQKSLLEIEYAAKYSLRSVVMVRMLALSVFHSLVLATYILFQHKRLDSGVGQLLIYGFTPMIIITGILLKLMQHCLGELLQSAAAGLCVLAMIVIITGNTMHFGWFQPACFKAWVVMCATGLAFLVRQFIRLNRKLASFDQIMQTE